MDNIEYFELGTILSVTTGYNCVDNFDKVWELIWFVCDDDMIGPIGLGTVKDKIKEHLFTLYPELKTVEFQKGKNINVFVSKQEEKFGKTLPVTKLGINLPIEDRIKKLSHLPSNDSEVIAELLSDFKYDPSKTEQILNKYNSLPEAERLIKTLN